MAVAAPVARRALAALALLMAVAMAFAVPSPAPAQQDASAQAEAPDYDAWSATAERAEEAVAARRASNAAFESLRGQIADWRQRFLDAQKTNAASGSWSAPA